MRLTRPADQPDPQSKHDLPRIDAVYDLNGLDSATAQPAGRLPLPRKAAPG